MLLTEELRQQAAKSTFLLWLWRWTAIYLPQPTVLEIRINGFNQAVPMTFGGCLLTENTYLLVCLSGIMIFYSLLLSSGGYRIYD